MVLHRDQAQFDQADWKLGILLPSWVAQITLLMTIVGVFSYRLAGTLSSSKPDSGLLIWESINISLALIALFITVHELLKAASERLTPVTMMISYIIKLVGAVLGLILDSIVYDNSSYSWSIAGIVVDSLLIIAVVVPGTYAALTYSRLVQYNDYHLPANAKHFGFKGDLEQPHEPSYEDVELGNAVDICMVTPPQPLKEKRISITNVVSFGSGNNSRQHSRSNSAAASYVSVDTTYQSETLPADPTISYIPTTSSGRRASYHHARDTAFEDYVAQKRESKVATSPPTVRIVQQRMSQQSFKDDVAAALDAEFGWGGRNRSSSQGSVLGGGEVAKKNVRDSMGRAPSQGSEMVSIEDEKTETSKSTRQHNLDEASRALLGRQRGLSDTISFVVTSPSPRVSMESRVSMDRAQ